MKNFMLLFLYQKKQTLFIVFFLLHIGLQAQEICNNGIDDDGDGYVDQYDPDCYTVPAPVCFAPAPAPNFQIELAMQGPANTLDVSISPTIGDLDGDGIPEIIAPLGNSATGYTSYHVIGGVLLNTGINFNIPLFSPVNGTVVQPAIADIDQDGTAEVITVGLNGYVYVFAHTGGSATTYKFISDAPTTIVYGSPRIADIDEDGVPEVIVGNHVFKFDLVAQTLTLAVNIPTSLPRGRDNANWGADMVVVDILPSNPGKEIVAGSVVYGVNMINGTYTILKNLNTIDGSVPLYTDGPTAVADLDLDGDLDVVFDNGARVYVWDPVEDALLLNVVSAGGNARRSIPTISYVYDDVANNGTSVDYPEILIGNRNILSAFNLQIPGNVVWSLATTDSSGETGVTSFDFNGDGIQELIYNDETQIRIINGNVNPPVNLATFSSGTETWMEHPVVADVDNDNQAEMIAFTGNPGAGSGQGRINIFKSVPGVIWQPARKVWNQRGYRVVNINDDLTVPAQETKISNFMPASSTSFRVLNQFNAQLNPNNLLLEPGTVAATDVQLNTITNFNLATGELTLDLSVLGGTNLPAGTPITIYNGDPTTTAATIVGTGLTPSVITSGTTQPVTVVINTSQSYNLYAIINDNGSIPTPFNLATDFPSAGMVECDYTNNMAFLEPPVYDTDGDGINDIDDLDDDNDGILDVDESNMNCSTGNYSIVSVDQATRSAYFENSGTISIKASLSSSGALPLIADPGSYLTPVNSIDYNNTFTLVHTLEKVNNPGFVSAIFYPRSTTFALQTNFTSFIIQFDESLFTATVENVLPGELNGSVPFITEGTQLQSNQIYLVPSVGTLTTNPFEIKFSPKREMAINETAQISWTQEYGGMDMNEEKSEMVFYGCDNLGDYDTDGDGIVDRLDLDSDNDGCPDSNEYYGDPNADGGDGGQFGPGPDPVATNPDGTVSHPAATYTGLLEPVRTAVSIAVNTAMPDQTANIGDDVTFTADASALRTTDFTTDPDTTIDATTELTYQWYVSTDGGTSFTILTGETNSALTVTNVQLANDEYVYRVMVSHPNRGGCAVMDSSQLSITQNPAIALVKTASIGGTGDVGDDITYTFTVTNTGDVTLTGIVIDDALTGSVDLPVDPSTLEPGETGTATASYAITQLDIETGNVSNTATVTGTAPNGSTATDISGTALDNDDSTETPIAQNPAIALVKTSEYKGDPLQAQLGDLITFTFTVHNTGNINIDNIIVDDPLLGGNISGPLSGDTNNNGILELTEIWVYEADYNITQPEVDNGVVENQATVDGTGSNGDPVNDISGTSVINDDETTTLLPPFSGISLVKTATFNDENGDGYPDAGETIGYSFTVENIGYQTLTNITVSDPMVTIAGDPITSLDPGDIDNTTFTANYTITQVDIDAGAIQNTATATGKNPANDDVSDTSGTAANNNDPTITILTENPRLEATKIGTITVPPGVEIIAVGNEIIFLIWVQNTGNVTLHGITLTDTFRDINGNPITLASGPDFVNADQGSAEGDLKVGEIANYTASYIIAQAEIDAGGISNSVVANGFSPANNPVSDISDNGVDTDGNTEDDSTVIPFGENPSIEATKTASITDNGDGQLGVGDVITYTITVQNTGNVTLDNVALTDTMEDASGNPLTLATGPTFSGSDQGSTAGNLLVGEIATYTATYQITQSDVDAGGVVNSALATGDSPAGTQVSDISDNGNDADGDTEDDTTDTTTAQNPAIALVKTANIGGTGTLGDDITYTFTVTNTGNVTLTGVVIDDALTGSAGLTVSPATLAPGQIGTATASYTIDQLDIEAGNVSNTATVTGTAPNSGTVTDISGTAMDNDDSTDTPIAQNPAIALVKTASIGGTGALGDDITYTFTVTNTGDVTLTGVVIDDALTGSAGLTVSPSTLTPGGTGTATASYTIDQLDIETGNVSNTATVTGTAPNGSTVTDISGTAMDNDDPTQSIIPRSPELILWKTGTYQDTNNDGKVNLGDHILFGFTVENTGNVDMMNITITDPMVTVDGGPILVLATGAADSTTFTAQYGLTQEDIDVGAVYNIAMAEGEDNNGDLVTVYSQDPSPLDPNDPYYDPGCAACSITVLDQQPGIAIIKYVLFDDNNNDGNAQIGETITYTFTIINTGNVMLTDITVEDPLPGIVMNGGPISLAPGASDTNTFTGRYVITASDLTVGSISNQATVSGLDPRGTLITDVSDNQDEFGNSPTIIEIEGCTLQVHNALSPNNDGMNDFLSIRGIECYPDNTVQIYNRWGVLVFEVDGYNNTSRVFQGFSDGRTTINRKEALPSGTYFYVLHINDGDGKTSTKKGYLNINR